MKDTPNQKEMKKYFVRTYGCQMNELDTEVMEGMLKMRGLEKTEEAEEADLLLFNTCSIRDLAERKAMGKIGKLGKTMKKEAIVGVTGCMANAKKETLFQKLPKIDFVLGTNNIHELNMVIDDVLVKKSKVLKTSAKFEHEIDYLSASREDKIKANVSIIRGCDKFCTYCVVPYTRGPEVSRTPESIIEECQRLVDQGYKEVTLLGQNVNSYGKDKAEWACLFHDLLYKVDAIKGLERVRFMTSHPTDITQELMEAVRDLKTLCEFVHFPLQAGSNRILKKMHRMYTYEEYMEKVELFRSIYPEVVLGTDIIVGFPTETDADFEATFEALKKIEYGVTYLFEYSPRKGTPAMRFKDDVPLEVKNERLQRLLKLQEENVAKHRSQMIGKTVEVLVEAVTTRDQNTLKGRTRCWKTAVFEGPKSLIGKLVMVEVQSFNHQTLVCSLKNPEKKSLLNVIN